MIPWHFWTRAGWTLAACGLALVIFGALVPGLVFLASGALALWRGEL